MAASIGKTSLILGAQWSALSKGLDKAYSECKGFKGRVSSLFSATGTKVAAGAGLAAGLVGAAGAAGLVSKALDTIEDKARQGAAAKAFGLTAEQFTGVAAVAKSVGEDSREFIESLVTIGKVASDGAAGKGEVAAEFFEKMNLNAKEFSNLRADQMFFRVFEALEQIEDPLTKNRMLMTAFGEDGGKALQGLLAKSSATIRGMAADTATSTAEMVQFERAQQSVVTATTAIDKSWQKVVLAIAPTVEAIASKIPSAVDALKPQFAALEGNAVPVAHRITVGVAKLWDVVRSGAGIITVVAAKISLGFGGVATTIGKALSLLNHLHPTSKAGDPTGLLDWAEDLKAKARDMTQKGMGEIGMTSSEAAEKWFAGWEQTRNQELRKAAAAVPQKPPAKPTGPGSNSKAGLSEVMAQLDEESAAAKQKTGRGRRSRDDDDGPARLERAASLLAGAMEKGSKEDYSTRVRFQTGQLNVVREQVAEQRKTTVAVNGVTTAVNKLAAKPPASPLRVI